MKIPGHGESIAIVNKLQCGCPFCDGEFSIGEYVDPDAEQPVPVLLHTMPPCAEFKKDAEPADFVKRARLAFEKLEKTKLN